MCTQCHCGIAACVNQREAVTLLGFLFFIFFSKFSDLVLFLCRLDKALIRPGRIDVKAKIDYCSQHQLEQMFCHFYPHEARGSAEQFAQKVLTVSKHISAAHVQGYFMLFKDSAVDAIKNVHLINEM